MPIPMLVGAATAFAPHVIDAISGASNQRRRALDRRNAAMDALLTDTQRDIGPNAVESAAFKTGQGMLQDQHKSQMRTTTNRMIASGATPEAQAGMNEAMNRSFNLASLRVLDDAQRRREMLKRQYAALLQQRTEADVADADQNLAWTGD